MNGRLKEKVADARDRLIEHPETAVTVFSGSARPAAGQGSAVQVRAHRFEVAPPPDLAGENAGPNAAELVLAALASCQEVTYRAWAAALGIPLDDVRVEVEGELDFRGLFAVCPNARPGFRRIRAKVQLSSSAAPEALDRLRRAVEEHCPVLDMLRRPVPVALEVVAPVAEQAA